MEKLTLEEVKNKLEDKNIFQRIDFIDQYDFNDSYKEYYIDFLLSNKIEKNYLYLSRLIDLAAFLKIKNEGILFKYMKYLIQPNHYIVKLSVLDFLIDSDSLYEEYSEKLMEMKLLLTRKRESKIVKNQILFNLLLIDRTNDNSYYESILHSLKETSDHRSLIRTINNLMNQKFSFVPMNFTNKTIEIIESKTTGKAVLSKLYEIKKHYNLA